MRRFWIFTRARVISFRHVAYIDYGFESYGTSWDRQGRRADQIETFSVDLVLNRDDERVPLFRFRGEGAAMTGLSGMVYGDALIDFSGTQEESSLRFVRLLERYLGVTLGKPMPKLKDAAGRAWSCLSCMRPGPPRKVQCLYCGGDLAPSPK